MYPSIRQDSLRRQRALQREILAYAVHHCSAKDSAEGIRTWWLSRPHRGVSGIALDRALQGLVRRGWVSTSSHGASTVYGVDKKRLGEIRGFLEA